MDMADDETEGEDSSDQNVDSGDHKFCSNCGEKIDEKAEICPECGVRVGSADGGEGEKDKIVAGILALLLGGLGAHKFYLGQAGIGLLYLCFFWTGIPALVGLVEGLIYLTKSDEEFQQKYG